jgi:hypothetical protein
MYFFRQQIIASLFVLSMLTGNISLKVGQNSIYMTQKTDTPIEMMAALQASDCGGTHLVNSSDRPIWVTARVPEGSGCAFRAIAIIDKSRDSDDIDALWVRCSNSEPGCERGRRPFKIGWCLGCEFYNNGSSSNLSLKGTIICQDACGWVDKSNTWPSASRGETEWEEPADNQLLPSLDVSHIICAAKCVLSRPPLRRGAVDGSVRSVSGAAINGATITLTSDEGPVNTITDSLGRYAFSHIPIGSVKIRAVKDSLEGEIAVEVRENVRTQAPDIVLAPLPGSVPQPPQLPPPSSQLCGPTTPVSPGDGETVRNRQVTFHWSGPNCSGLNGYTLHITTGSGAEDGIILDQGVGPTEYSFTFPKDGTFYWHVAAWSNGQRGPWSSRRVVIDTTQVQPPPPDCDPGTDGIVLYEHANYQGRCRNIRGDEANFGNISGWLNDQASSLQFRGYYAGRYEVTLFKSADYGDARGPFRDNIANLSAYDINDQASSIRIKPLACTPSPDQVSLHYERNFGGACVILGIGNYPDPGQLAPVGNDSAWSVRVGTNVQATLYTNANFDGTAVTFTSDNSDLGFTPINGGTSSVKVEARPVAPTPAPTPPPPTVSRCDVPSGQFCAEYFNNRTLDGNPTFTQKEAAVDHRWGASGPGNGVSTDNFSVRWVGRFRFDDAEYDFSTAADDGIRIFIDDQPIIDQWRDQPLSGYSKRQRLAGDHTVKVEYYENGGDAAVGFGWTKVTNSSSGSRCSVPAGTFCTEYFTNRTLSGEPALVREESVIDHNWGDGGPGGSIGNDNFSVRWVGRFAFNGGQYSFLAGADDGVRVWVDNDLVIDAWRDQPYSESRANRTLSGEHTVKVEYYENGGGAAIHVEWSEAVVAQPAGWRSDQWQGVSVFSAASGVAHSGSRSARISSATNNDARWIQTVAVRPNTSYKLSGWVRTENVAHATEAVDAGANLCLFNTWTRSNPVFGTSDWTLVTLEFNSGNTAEVTIGARLGYWSGTTTGTAWFDELELREQTSQGPGPNLLQNGGFEQ